MASCSENVCLSSYASSLPIEAKLRYVSKLAYNKGTSFLPDPYALSTGWVDDPAVPVLVLSRMQKLIADLSPRLSVIYIGPTLIS